MQESSSLKYQLIDMDNEEMVAKGIVNGLVWKEVFSASKRLTAVQNGQAKQAGQRLYAGKGSPAGQRGRRN